MHLIRTSLQRTLLTIVGVGGGTPPTLNPSPLNSGWQASNNKQAHLLSVFVIAPFQRFGLYSTLAIFCIDTCPSQIQNLSPQLTSGGLGRHAKLGGGLPGRCKETGLGGST